MSADWYSCGVEFGDRVTRYGYIAVQRGVNELMDKVHVAHRRNAAHKRNIREMQAKMRVLKLENDKLKLMLDEYENMYHPYKIPEKEAT